MVAPLIPGRSAAARVAAKRASRVLTFTASTDHTDSKVYVRIVWAGGTAVGVARSSESIEWLLGPLVPMSVENDALECVADMGERDIRFDGYETLEQMLAAVEAAQ